MANDTESLFECMNLMTGGWPTLRRPDAIGAIFVWGRAKGEYTQSADEDGVLELAAYLHRETRAVVVIPGYTGSQQEQGDFGYPGPEIWQNELRAVGVPLDKIVALTGCGHNTKTEFEDFIRWYRFRDFTKPVLGVTQQAHALRAMLGALKSIKTIQIRLRIAPIWPTKINQGRSVFGSQGLGPYPRYSWIGEEYRRIQNYQKKGDLSDFSQLRHYLQGLHNTI